jgi:hypothetical protein
MLKASVHGAKISTEVPAPDVIAPAMLDLLLQRAVSHPAAMTPNGLLTGRITAFSADGIPLVECSALSPESALPAASLVPLDKSHLGRRVALMCADGDYSRPVIMGVLAIDPSSFGEGLEAPQASVRVDGKSVTLSASEEIVLQCGKASIVLTRAGKVLINGNYISSRSTGANRIKGGSVQFN